MKYPMHEKLKAVKEASQAQGAFLEWLLSEKGYRLATDHEHDEACPRKCPRADELEAVHARTETLLAEYHEIDLEILEKEKLAMIEELRR